MYLPGLGAHGLASAPGVTTQGLDLRRRGAILDEDPNAAAGVSPTFWNPCGAPFSMKNAGPEAAAAGFDEPMVISSFPETGTHR